MLLTREKIDSCTFRFITQKKSLDERFSLCIAGKKKFKCDEKVQDKDFTIYLLDNHWYHLYICTSTLFSKELLSLHTIAH